MHPPVGAAQGPAVQVNTKLLLKQGGYTPERTSAQKTSRISGERLVSELRYETL